MRRLRAAIALPSFTSGALSRITSHTDISRAITDTSVALDIGQLGSIDCLLTLKGAVTAPAMNIESGKGR